MKKLTTQWARYATWAARAGLPLMLVGCGSDPEESAKSSEELTVLDCTEVDGRPEDFPPDIPEVYHADVMKMHLERFESLRDDFGQDEVTNCAEARRFAELFEEHADEVAEGWAEEYPPETLDSEEVPPATDDDPEAEGEPDLPPILEEDEAGAAADTEASTDIEKIANGIDSTYPFDVKLVIEKPLETDTKKKYVACSATVVGLKTIITAAHCIPEPFIGSFNVTVSQQVSPGVNPTTMFSGATKIYFYKNPFWIGGKNYGYDTAVGAIWDGYSNHTFPTSMRARIWMDSVAVGATEYHTGFGMTAPGGSSGHQHYGYGRISYVDDWGYYIMDPYASSTPRTICPGDSGGTTFYYHGIYPMLHAVNSHCYCGSDGYRSYVARVSFTMPWIELCLANFGATCTNYTIGGQYYKKCW